MNKQTKRQSYSPATIFYDTRASIIVALASILFSTSSSRHWAAVVTEIPERSSSRVLAGNWRIRPAITEGAIYDKSSSQLRLFFIILFPLTHTFFFKKKWIHLCFLLRLCAWPSSSRPCFISSRIIPQVKQPLLKQMPKVKEVKRGQSKPGLLVVAALTACNEVEARRRRHSWVSDSQEFRQ